jgi:hypothetical protein
VTCRSFLVVCLPWQRYIEPYFCRAEFLVRLLSRNWCIFLSAVKSFSSLGIIEEIGHLKLLQKVAVCCPDGIMVDVGKYSNFLICFVKIGNFNLVHIRRIVY